MSSQDARLLDRRPGRQARRQQQAVLLLQPRVPSDDTTRSTAATRSALRVPTALERAGRLLADARQQRQADPAVLRDPLHATAAVRGQRRPGKIRRVYAPGLGDPEPLSAAEPARRRRARTTTTKCRVPTVKQPDCSSRRSASTTSCRRSCASPASTRPARSAAACTPGLDPGLQRRADPVSVHHELRRSRRTTR